jgi:hypothetical protein
LRIGGKSLMNAEILLEKEEKLSDGIRLFCVKSGNMV